MTYERPPTSLDTYGVVEKLHGKDFQDKSLCRWCKKPREEWAEKQKQFYCSDGCREKFYEYQSENFVWNGIREKIWERDGKKCVSCNVELPHLTYAQIDHIKALVNGGDPFDKTNLQTLCQSCHSKKTGKDIRLKNRVKKMGHGETIIDLLKAA